MLLFLLLCLYNATKGQRRVGSITSWEREKNITLLCAMSAAGGYIPLIFTFPRKRLTPLLEKDDPAGAFYKCSDNGWINENLFLQWLVHFKQHSKLFANEPIFSILGNHACRIVINTRKCRKKQHAAILTSTPIKENLIEK